MNLILIISYNFAIIIANGVIFHFGPKALPVTAFFLIPFDLVARDILHERWTGSVKFKMSALVLSGSLISYFLNFEAKQIAMASFFSFGAAGFVNYIFFEILKKKSRATRMNTSNFFAATADSVLFQLIAFSTIDTIITTHQITLKFIGGVFWIFLLARFIRNEN